MRIYKYQFCTRFKFWILIKYKMPRSTSSSRKSVPSSPSIGTMRKSLAPSDPTPTVPAPTVPVQPSFMQSIKQGFGFGMGSSIAHNIFDSPKTVTHVHTAPNQSYTQCMKDSDNDVEACKHLLKSA
jgi:hypothetical protein